VWHLEDLRVGQCYPNYYVARLASRFVKVVLSGGGGDEAVCRIPLAILPRPQGNGDEQACPATTTSTGRLVPDQDRAAFFNETTYARVREHDPRVAFQNVFEGHAPARGSVEDVVNASLYFESKTFLHGLLVVEDKLSMAHSLETRVPFLDNDLVDFALRIPPRLKLRELDRAPVVDEDEPGKRTRYRLGPTADGKVLLRQAMRRLVPKRRSTR
jgi:asparagine synthase (glutamine-hydrolysing)